MRFNLPTPRAERAYLDRLRAAWRRRSRVVPRRTVPTMAASVAASNASKQAWSEDSNQSLKLRVDICRRELVRQWKHSASVKSGSKLRSMSPMLISPGCSSRCNPLLCPRLV